MKPSIGRVVHYVAYGTPGGEYPQACRAAIITEVMGPDVIPMTAYEDVREDTVGLAVLNPTGMFFNRSIPHNEGDKSGGSWHWPEREPSVGADTAPYEWDGMAVGPGTPDGGK
jgi:hypothetical protein